MTKIEVFGCAKNCPFGLSYGASGGMCNHPALEDPRDIPEFDRQFTPKWCPLADDPVEVTLIARKTAPMTHVRRPFEDTE